MSSELSFFDENIPCLAACPVHTNAGMYVAAIADGDDEQAYLTARMPNPFASVCGLVCAAPCEDACRRGAIDRPIAIRALKRFVTEKYGPESGNIEEGGEVWKKVIAPPSLERPESIGIVGGGPAGMGAAHDLRRWGYQVTVYEATDKLGGAMWLGIPEYRLDRGILQGDIDQIVNLGVDVQYNTKIGVDISFDELRERHDALFLAIGAGLGRKIPIDNVDADGVVTAIEFLINMNRGFQVDIGEKVIVIGGGDVAMDAARTALRGDDYDIKREEALALSVDDRSPMTEAFDVARSLTGDDSRDLTIMSLESREEMPAHAFEIEEAEHEKIRFVNRRGPRAIMVKDGVVVGLKTVGVKSVFDAEGRFSPVFDEDDIQILEADTVILAIGQAIELEVLGENGPDEGPRGTIGIDWDTGATSMDGVWAGGDAAKGPRTLITAIADGRASAAEIHKSFGGVLESEKPGKMVELKQFHRLDDDYDRIDRLSVPVLETGRRTGLAQVELGFTEEQARCEAKRCLRCFANILLDPQKCVLCALCADVCPVDVISLVPTEELNPEEKGGTVLLLDETACIRCGLCIERCPPDALSMGMWSGVGVPEWT